MTMKDLLMRLKEDGINVSARRIWYAIDAGYVPKPPMNSALMYVYTAKHVAALRQYFLQQAERRQRVVVG